MINAFSNNTPESSKIQNCWFAKRCKLVVNHLFIHLTVLCSFTPSDKRGKNNFLKKNRGAHLSGCWRRLKGFNRFRRVSERDFRECIKQGVSYGCQVENAEFSRCSFRHIWVIYLINLLQLLNVMLWLRPLSRNPSNLTRVRKKNKSLPPLNFLKLELTLIWSQENETVSELLMKSGIY